RADMLTFEIELADADLLADVQDETGVPVHPRPSTLRMISDKLVQKRQLEAAGVPVPPFRPAGSPAALEAALDELGTPAMLKARRGGYDGRGNVVVEDGDDLAAALDAVGGDAMVEAFMDYDRELSVIGCLGQDDRDMFPVTETIHEQEILRQTVTPARTGDAVKVEAREVADQVLDVMDGRGVYGIELFEVDGDILLNEIAPRPHNSGHWTIEGAATSQFAQHLRAVTGQPLGSTAIRGPTAMANILGDVSEEQPARLDGIDQV
ncbi:MAG: 5-(carboxyamino)imidazole ribonucleotide synthase, partial [Candidatus Nanohaloarchaea archaeon]